MNRLVLRPEVSNDIRSAAFWYDERQVGLGRRFLAEVDHVFERVTENPAQFPRIEDHVRRALLRKYPYAVYFVFDRDQVTILAVLHCRRDPSGWRTRQ